MSAFDSAWDAAASLMDTAVDDRLGDRLRYRHGGVWLGDVDVAEADRTIPGFVIDETPISGIDEIDETLGDRKRVKVAKALVGQPVIADRIQHPRLGAGLFRPIGGLPQSQGRYWIIEIQEASA